MAHPFSPKIAIWLAAGLLVTIATLFSVSAKETPELPRFGEVPSFELFTTQKTRFGRENLLGKVSVLSFFFTSCPATCPTLNGNVASLYRTYAGDKQVQFVSITVDPETDTPEVLAEYSSRFKADPQQWLFLYGEPAQIKSLRYQGLKLDSGESVQMHTTRVLLVDQSGYVRGYYQGTDAESMRELGRDIQIVRTQDPKTPLS